MINEGFDRKYQPLQESEVTPKEELRTALYNKCSDLMSKNEYNIKAYEIAFQEVIEGLYPERPWWEVTSCNIFMDLFNGRDPMATVENIVSQMNESESGEDTGTISGEVPDESLIEALKEVLNRMNEAEMSDEDKHDSELIYSMIQKIQNRSNAAFTPEEKAVMAKYGITRHNWAKKLSVAGRDLNPNLDTKSRHLWYGRSYSNGTPRKINYADRARKLPQRKANQVAGDGSSMYHQNGEYNSHGPAGGRSLLDVERAIDADRMGEPVATMSRALSDRRYAQDRIDGAGYNRERRMAAAQAAYDKAKKDADWHYEYDTVDSTRQRDRAQDKIDSLLKRGKKEDSSDIVESVNDTYTDVGGILGEIGAKYTMTDIKQIWHNGKDNDPAMVHYDGDFNTWLGDTMSYMELDESKSIKESEKSIDDILDMLGGHLKFYEFLKDIIEAYPGIEDDIDEIVSVIWDEDMGVTEDELASAIEYIIDDVLDESKSIKESPSYDMRPQYDSRQSFYGKARVDDDGGELTLYSYNTPVAKISGGKVQLLPKWDLSQTTLRHVKEFLRQNGFEAVSLAQMRRDYQ